MQVIISGTSSPDVLTDDGIVNFARAIGLYVFVFLLFLLVRLCMGQHLK